MPAIPPELNNRLRETLVHNSVFRSGDELQTFFTDARIAAWRDRIPDNTPNRTTRVIALIHTLYDKADAADENTLVLFLHVLADATDPANAFHTDLIQLAADLTQHLASGTHGRKE